MKAWDCRKIFVPFLLHEATVLRINPLIMVKKLIATFILFAFRLRRQAEAIANALELDLRGALIAIGNKPPLLDWSPLQLRQIIQGSNLHFVGLLCVIFFLLILILSSCLELDPRGLKFPQ